MVSSTDKFQGQEADVVIISLVQTHGHGFLDSPNRMNRSYKSLGENGLL